MSGVVLSKEQECAATNRGGALLVSAAAGSGKTRVLVERLLRRVLDPAEKCDIDDFLVITFTKAAAAELRGRILEELNRRSAEDPANRHLRRQASLCCRAQIGTIHSFCVTILREYAYILGISPDFRVADEQESLLLREHTADNLLEELYEDVDALPGFTELVEAVTSGRDDRKLVTLLLDTHAKLQSHPEPKAWAEEQNRAFAADAVTDVSQTVWGDYLLKQAIRRGRYWVGRLKRLAADAREDPIFWKGYGLSLEASCECGEAFISAMEKGWDAAAQYGPVVFPRPKPVRGDYDLWKDERQLCKKALDKIAESFLVSSDVLLKDLKTAAPAVQALMRLTMRFDEVYTAEKRKRNLLDFADQEHLAVRLLAEPGTETPTEQAKEISRRFEEIMVDEYQDVNAVQDLIFRAVSRNGENLFMVGDVKQSIYRFRLADPTIFLNKYAAFPDMEESKPGEGRKVLLSTNYRSHPGVLSAVNFLFENLMSETVGEMEYGKREALYPGPGPFAEIGSSMELAVVESGERGIDAEADFAALRIRELLETGRVSDKNGGLRPVKPGDIAILMRSPSSRLAVYTQALEKQNIPVDAGNGGSFFRTEEIAVALSILTVLDNPCQDVPLVSAMMSPVWGFTADEMTRVRLADKNGDLWSAVKCRGEEDEHCRRFLQDIAELRTLAPELSADELIWHMYNVTSLPALMGSLPAGAGRRRNLMTLYELARSYEAAGYKGLCRFIPYVRELMEKGKEPETTVESREDAVHIMSIHKSKGLEFPIVLLCDTSHRFNMEDMRKTMLFHPKMGAGPLCTDTVMRTERTTLARMAVERALKREMLSEELRVLYVGLTRAREKLIVTVRRKAAEEELKKLAVTASLPVPPEVMEDCASMGDWILLAALCRSECGVLRFGSEVSCMETDDHVWDVKLIRNAEEEHGEKEEKEESRENIGIADTALIRERLTFRYPHEAARDLPSKVTATELKGMFRDREAAEEAVMLTKASGIPEVRRPDFMPVKKLTAAQAGTAQHLAMQYCDYAACVTEKGAAEEVEKLLQKGILTRQQAEAVMPEKMTAFVCSPIGRRVLSAEKVWRELKFSLLTDASAYFKQAEGEKILLQGVVDCCILENGKLTVIDFKTDRVSKNTVHDRAREYAAQLSAYAEAMERMLGYPVKEKLLYFFSVSDAVGI